MNEHTTITLEAFLASILPYGFSVQRYVSTYHKGEVDVFLTIKKGEQPVVSQSDHIRLYIYNRCWNIVTDVDGNSQNKEVVEDEKDIVNYLHWNLLYIE